MLNKYLFNPATSFIILSLTLIALSCSPDKSKETNDPPAGTHVKITNPVETDLSEYIELNAEVVYLNKQTIRSTFPGFVEAVLKYIGDKIEPGETLFRVRTKEAIAADSLRIGVGKSSFNGTVSFKASAKGILTHLNYYEGDFVSEGDVVAIISNPSSLRISLNVPYQYASRIYPATTCLVILPDGLNVPATIDRVLPSVDPETQTQTFILLPDSKINIPEKLNVTVRLPVNSISKATAVSKSAVLSNETLDKFWVMKLINDSTVVRVDIDKGIENDSLVQILSPDFNLSDRIISDGAFGLPDTAIVKYEQ